MASKYVIPFGRQIGCIDVLDSQTIYAVYKEVIELLQINFPHCSLTDIQDRLKKQGKLYLLLFLSVVYFGHIPVLIGNQRREFKTVGKLWLSFKKLVDTRKAKSFGICYEFLSKQFRQEMLTCKGNQEAVDRFAITTWFQVQQYEDDQCMDRKRILNDMLHSLPEHVDRTVAEIVFCSKMATTAEFENDIQSAKDFASRAKFLSEICCDKTAKVLAHYSYFFLHRRLYLRDKTECNRRKANEQCTIGCDMFPVPDEDGDFEMYCALLFLLYKAGDYLQITYELEALDSDSITKASIAAAEEVLKSAHKYIAMATPRKRLSYAYCMGRLHHLKSEFENANDYLQETREMISCGILNQKEKTYVAEYCKRFETEFRCGQKSDLLPIQDTERNNSDEDERTRCTVHEKPSTAESTAFKRCMIEHYRQMPEISTHVDSLKKLRGKLRIQLRPKFETVNKQKGSGHDDERVSHKLAPWEESQYLDPDENNRVMHATAQGDVVSETFIDLLITWLDSVENEERLLPDDSNLEYYDAVIYFKGLRHNSNEENFDSLVRHNLAEKFGLSLVESSNGISCCRRCLVLLENVLPSYLSTVQIGSPYLVICAVKEETGQSDRLGNFHTPNTYVTHGGRQVTIALKGRKFLTIEEGHELEKWLNTYLADHSTNEGQHTVCFENMNAEKDVNITLSSAAHVEILELSNCNRSFTVAHEAETLLLRGKSILTLDKHLLGSPNIRTLYLCFEHDPQGQEKCHTISEFIVENLLTSVDKCRYLQSIELRNLAVGRRHINHSINRSTIEHIKDTTKIRTACSRLLGPSLELEKLDFDSESSEFVKAIILDVICHKVLTSNKDILEAYACEERQNEMSRVSIVCFTLANACTTQPKEYVGFPVLYKPHDSVSTESTKAEADKIGIEYNIKDIQKGLCRTISSNVDHLFRVHSNLEAVCGSLVRSRKSGIDKSAPSIVLYCRWKGMVPYGEKEFPKVLEYPDGKNSYFTDIREGFFVFGPNGNSLSGGATVWNQELSMGCSIGPKGGKYSATLGPFLNICDINTTCFLTVRHMFMPLDLEESKVRGQKIVQPADGDELVGNQAVGIHRPDDVRLCGSVMWSSFSDKVDAAVVLIDESRMPSRGNFVSVTKDALNFTGFSESNFPKFDSGDMLDATTFTVSDHATERIIKFGKQTGLTRGTLDLKEMAVKIKDDSKLSINYNGRMQEQVMNQQLKINSYSDNPFFLCGDSGSAVFLVEKDNKLHCIGMAIGLLTDGSCVVTPIQNILETLNKDSPQGKKVELKTFTFERMTE